MFADNTALLTENKKDLQKLINEFSAICEMRKLTVNLGKSKVMF